MYYLSASINGMFFSAEDGLLFNGLDNFRRLVFDADFLTSVGLTIRFAFFAIVSQIVLGFLLAQMLTRNFPGKSIFRVIHTLPLMVAPIAVGAIWRLLVIPGFGPAPFFLDRWFDITYQIGTYPDQALLTSVIMDVWHLDALCHADDAGGSVGHPQGAGRAGQS